jgi:hypothetical protein
MRTFELHGLAERAEHRGRRGEVVCEAVRQAGGGPEARQVHGDHIALGREDVHHRVPGLPVVTDAVQEEQWFATAHARVGDGHGAWTTWGRDLEGDGAGHGGAPLGRATGLADGLLIDSLSAIATDG